MIPGARSGQNMRPVAIMIFGSVAEDSVSLAPSSRRAVEELLARVPRILALHVVWGEDGGAGCATRAWLAPEDGRGR